MIVGRTIHREQMPQIQWRQSEIEPGINCYFPRTESTTGLCKNHRQTELGGRAWDKACFSWYLQVLTAQPYGGRPAHIPTWSLAVFLSSLSRSLFPAGWDWKGVLRRPATTVSEYFTSPECSSLIMRLAGVDVAGKITAFLVSTDSHSQPKSTALPATDNVKQDLMKQANVIWMLCKW